MIKIKYKALLSLEFAHTFYKSGKCPDLEMIPSENCARLIRSFGLLYLPSEFGGKLYAKVNNLGGNDIMQNPLPEGIKFTFLLKLKNRIFENITSINLLKPAGHRYYFNNLINNLAEDTTPLLVATGKIVSDGDLLQFVSGSFSSVESSTAPTQTGKLIFTDSGESAETVLNNSNNVFNHNFNLQKHENGRAKFLVDGAEKGSFYSIDAAELSDLFGLVEIFYKATLPASYQFQNGNNSVTSRTYRIAFANRHTRWRYIITRKFNPAISSLTVAKSNGTSINFTLLGGTPEGTFIATSDNALPLSEEKVAGIKLTDNTNKVIIANLPNPPLNLIKTEGSDTFSDILITI
ncbi:MAG: hypothetical protein EOO07_23405 [Chitinophagaceae bacterium]|nr:MAG: hypothetical protein EOO07_23405 [Chitinophagaceae bacterium]